MFPPPAPVPTPTSPLADPPSAPPPASRIGGIEMTEVRLLSEPNLEASGDFLRMSDRLHRSEAVIDALRERGDPRLDALLTEALDGLVAEGKVEGLLIGSEEGFVVAQSSRLDQGELLAVVGVVFEMTVRRLQLEGVIPSVQEMTARGTNGEQIVLRFFPDLPRRLFLLAYSRQSATYRRTTARALKRCGEILARAVGSPSPATRRPGRARRPTPPAPPPTDPSPFPPANPGGPDATPVT